MSTINHSHQLTGSNKNHFPARLKDENNKLLEIGLGSVSLESKSVDFFNEFVPLLKFRSVARIIKLIGTEECHCFEGRVYLSSKSRLQLTDVTDRFITNKELTIPQKVHLSATVAATGSANDGESAEIEIFNMSLEEIHFTIGKQFQPSRHMILRANDGISIDGIVISIYKELQFSEEKTVYYANITRCTDISKKAIIEFLAPKLILFPQA